MKIRNARVEDAEVILELIQELAVFEKAPSEVTASVNDIRQTLFDDDPKVFCELVEDSGQVQAMAIWFLSYSTWQGKHGLFLEDLYVRESARGKGFGKALLAHLAKKCVDSGLGRFQWSVLDWNTPAIEFYLNHGAVAMDEWTTFRVSGDNIAKLANLT